MVLDDEGSVSRLWFKRRRALTVIFVCRVFRVVALGVSPPLIIVMTSRTTSAAAVFVFSVITREQETTARQCEVGTTLLYH